MQLSVVALLIATSLAMSDAVCANAGGGDGAARQPPAGAALESFSPAAPNDVADLARARRLVSPRIEGDALIIEGKIDSHIYDYLQYEAAKIIPVKVIELNSLGGSNEWALEIARKIRELGKTTVLLSGHSCASACAYLFAAGRERVASEDTWIGVHGARLGASYLTTFQGL